MRVIIIYRHQFKAMDGSDVHGERDGLVRVVAAAPIFTHTAPADPSSVGECDSLGTVARQGSLRECACSHRVLRVFH